MERANIILTTKIGVITDLTYQTLLETIRLIVENDKAIYDGEKYYIIPLQLSAYPNVKALTINQYDLEEVEVIDTKRKIWLQNLILEMQTAILTDLLMRYFDIEDI